MLLLNKENKYSAFAQGGAGSGKRKIASTIKPFNNASFLNNAEAAKMVVKRKPGRPPKLKTATKSTKKYSPRRKYSSKFFNNFKKNIGNSFFTATQSSLILLNFYSIFNEIIDDLKNNKEKTTSKEYYSNGYNRQNNYYQKRYYKNNSNNVRPYLRMGPNTYRSSVSAALPSIFLEE